MNPIARTQDELLRMVLNHRGTVTGIMTPECAGWLLNLNTGNRRLRESDVRKFQGILERGEWINTGEPIIVSSDGVLNDGQHRLEGIFRSCRSAEVDVRFGVARAAMDATGQQRPRTASDVFEMNGELHTNRFVATLRLVDGYRRGVLLRTDEMKLTPVQYLHLAERHPLVRKVVQRASAYKTRGVNAAPFLAVLTIAAEEADLGTALRFGELVETGQSDRGDAARELRERILKDAAARAKMGQTDRMALCIRAWNAWVAGREVKILRVEEGDRSTATYPRVMGQPKARLRSVSVA